MHRTRKRCKTNDDVTDANNGYSVAVVVGAFVVLYCRKFIKKMMSARLRPLHDMLKKSGSFTFTADHVKLVREMVDILASPKVLAFPCYEGAISGERPFRLVADASVAGLGAVIEQAQKYGSVRPIWFLSRTTYSNETRWNATELEMGAIVWTVKKNRTLFYGIPFQNFRTTNRRETLGVWRRKKIASSDVRFFVCVYV